MLFPPFCDIAVYTVSSTSETLTRQNAATFREMLECRVRERMPDAPWELYGPFEAQTYKSGNKFRQRIVMKCRLNKQVRRVLWDAILDAHLEKRPSLGISLDLNPTTTL
jgi:primosomal protein N' (replication factor Y)